MEGTVSKKRSLLTTLVGIAGGGTGVGGLALLAPLLLGAEERLAPLPTYAPPMTQHQTAPPQFLNRTQTVWVETDASGRNWRCKHPRRVLTIGLSRNRQAKKCRALQF